MAMAISRYDAIVNDGPFNPIALSRFKIRRNRSDVHADSHGADAHMCGFMFGRW